jgi:hypothetical protein
VGNDRLLATLLLRNTTLVSSVNIEVGPELCRGPGPPFLFGRNPGRSLFGVAPPGLRPHRLYGDLVVQVGLLDVVLGVAVEVLGGGPEVTGPIGGEEVRFDELRISATSVDTSE